MSIDIHVVKIVLVNDCRVVVLPSKGNLLRSLAAVHALPISGRMLRLGFNETRSVLLRPTAGMIFFSRALLQTSVPEASTNFLPYRAAPSILCIRTVHKD